MGQRLYIRVYAPAEDGNGRNLLYALDPRDGSVLWKATVGVNTRETPLEANGRVYIPDDHALVALRASDGHVLWRLQVSPYVAFGTPAVLDQVVFVQAHFGASARSSACPDVYPFYEALFAANATTGALYWRSAANPGAWDPVGDE